MKVSPLNPSWLERPAMQSSQHFKNFKKDHLFEGTVDSRKHNSWDTETNTTVFVMRLLVSI